MKISNFKFQILILITILAATLRLWNLASFPAGLNADEAAIGYNAYSLIQTGKDEYGTFLPLAFKSFGDYKPGLYFYFVAPFVWLFGLNEWAVRLPSALLGIGTVILIYFLAKKIFQNEKVGILSAFLLAISPWHLHFSRGGWETNAATFFITLSILLFIYGLQKTNLIFWSLVAGLAAMYTYQSPRLIIPILFLFLIILYKDNLTSILRSMELRKKLIYLLFLVILSIPLILQFASGAGGVRFSGLSSFADPGPSSRVNELRGEHIDSNSFPSKLIHNKLTAYGPNFLGHYLDHFKGDFLFISGDPLIRNKVPETGQFYLIQTLFLAVGLIFLIKGKFHHAKLLISWILVAPLASSITYQTPHALRSLNMVIPLTLVMGYGLWVTGEKLKGRVNIIIIMTISIILTFEFIHYLESYYIHYPKRYPLAWEYGFKEMVSKLEKYEPQYKKIVMTDRYDQPYILVLFYKKYDPAKYQPQAYLSPRDKFNFGTVRNFDKYEFRPIKPEEVGSNEDTLFIGTENEIPKDASVVDKVNFPNDQPAFLFAKGGKR